MKCKSTWNRLGLTVVDVESKNRILPKKNLVKTDKNRVAKKIWGREKRCRTHLQLLWWMTSHWVHSSQLPVALVFRTFSNFLVHQSHLGKISILWLFLWRLDNNASKSPGWNSFWLTWPRRSSCGSANNIVLSSPFSTKEYLSSTKLFHFQAPGIQRWIQPHRCHPFRLGQRGLR